MDASDGIAHAESVLPSIGSSIDGSSFQGLLIRVEIGVRFSAASSRAKMDTADEPGSGGPLRQRAGLAGECIGATHASGSTTQFMAQHLMVKHGS